MFKKGKKFTNNIFYISREKNDPSVFGYSWVPRAFFTRYFLNDRIYTSSIEAYKMGVGQLADTWTPLTVSLGLAGT